MAHLKVKDPITEDDFTCNFVHVANQDFIHELVFKYNLSSRYPQPLLCKYKMPIASNLVEINGIEVHLILEWYPDLVKYKFGLWAFPNREEHVVKFTSIISILFDINRSHFFSK
jgi:hypothetical protein